MYIFLSLLQQYPYPYKLFAAIVTALILVTIGLPVYGIYRLRIWKMTERINAVFHKVLKIVGICVGVIFMAEMTVSMITQHQVNKQLGFNYATPETPEGEFFVITKVVPS